MKRIALLVSVIALALAAAGVAHAQSGGAFELTWFSVDGGGATDLSGGTFELGSTAGQPDAATVAGGTFELQGGFWNPSSSAPLAVTLASFTATTDGQQVLVSWETVSELNNAGFNLYRSETDTGPEVLLAFVPSQSPGSSQGHAYTYRDGAVQPGLTYWYWLEDVSLSGVTTLHGPVSVTVAAPTAVGLADFGESSQGQVPAALPPWLFFLAPPAALVAAALAAALFAGQRRRRLSN